MTNRDEIKQSVDEMLAGWFDGERYEVDKDDIIELVMKHVAPSLPVQPPELTSHEIDFCLLVLNCPGAKLNGDGQASHWEDDGSEYGRSVSHWNRPEELGLIACVGGYKWVPTDKLKGMVRAGLSAQVEQPPFDAMPSRWSVTECILPEGYLGLIGGEAPEGVEFHLAPGSRLKGLYIRQTRLEDWKQTRGPLSAQAQVEAGWERIKIETGRKSGTTHADVWPEGEGWEIDTDRGRVNTPDAGWDRFSHHEELYFRRRSNDLPAPEKQDKPD